MLLSPPTVSVWSSSCDFCANSSTFWAWEPQQHRTLHGVSLFSIIHNDSPNCLSLLRTGHTWEGLCITALVIGGALSEWPPGRRPTVHINALTVHFPLEILGACNMNNQMIIYYALSTIIGWCFSTNSRVPYAVNTVLHWNGTRERRTNIGTDASKTFSELAIVKTVLRHLVERNTGKLGHVSQKFCHCDKYAQESENICTLRILTNAIIDKCWKKFWEITL